MLVRNNELFEEERKLLVEQERSEKVNRVLNIIKTIAFGIASIFAFLYITKPQSEHMINRERTKLVLEILKEKDPKIRAQGIALIKETYPKLDPVMQQIINSIKEDASSDVLKDYSTDYELLYKKQQQLRESLTRATNSTERQIILNNLKMVEMQVNETKKLLDRYQ